LKYFPSMYFCLFKILWGRFNLVYRRIINIYVDLFWHCMKVKVILSDNKIKEIS